MHLSRSLPNHKFFHERVRVIIAHCFIPNPKKYRYVNHKNSDKTDNRLENLEWCSNSYNVKHGWDSGNRKSKIKIKVTMPNGAVQEFSSIRQATKTLNLDRHKIARILKGELRPNYFNNYKFEYVCPTTIEKVSDM